MNTGMPVESPVRGDVHAGFGGRAGETGRPKGRYRASARPYVFRHNRRRTPLAGFQTLLGLGASRSPTTYHEITHRPNRPTEQSG
jgi:hypothetical protein